MSYRICEDNELVCKVANLLFDESKDFWLGYYTHEDILNIIDLMDSEAHEIAETLIDEIKSNIKVEDCFEVTSDIEPEREFLLLSYIGENKNKLSYEQFVDKYGVHRNFLESLFRLSLVAVLCLVESASKCVEILNALSADGFDDVNPKTLEDIDKDDGDENEGSEISTQN